MNAYEQPDEPMFNRRDYEMSCEETLEAVTRDVPNETGGNWIEQYKAIMKTRLHGLDAINYAEKHGARLAKYNDPIERGRRVTLEEAREIAKVDPNLIYALPQSPQT